jgi:predicted DNA-binding antitoxin AbrB/MazE fold protein
VRGKYEQGIVKPLESTPHREGIEVLILFPEQVRPTGKERIWQQIKEAMGKEMPDLLNMTKDEKREEFDRLSSIIAERMSFDSLEEFERAMRGDDYGLAGH